MEPIKTTVTPEHELLFRCTRQQFLDDNQQAVLTLTRDKAVNWQSIFSTAQIHGVAPLVYHNLQQLPAQQIGLPPEIAKQFRVNLMQNMLAKEQLAQNAAKAIAFFLSHNIETMLIKGIALDRLVYTQPWYTATGDVDLVINLKRDQVPDDLFQNFMNVFHHSAIEYDYFEHHDVTMNGILPVDFDKIWKDAVEINFRGQTALVMCPEDLLIAVCINSCRKRYFRLKALADIAEIINVWPQLDWERVNKRAAQYHCRDIVYTAVLITKMTLGCAVSETVVNALAGSSTKAQVIGWLSARMSLTAFSSLYSEHRVFNRSLDWSLLLPYVSLEGHQVWRKIKFAASHDFRGVRRGEPRF